VVESEAAVAGCTPAQLVDRSVGGAKLLADEAAIGNCRTAIQVHGGMGFTWEVPLHLHRKRARLHSTTFGTPAAHASALAAYAGSTTST
jgi:alkylation response protein AidB-like acyl-CoA dehydrogenase